MGRFRGNSGNATYCIGMNLLERNMREIFRRDSGLEAFAILDDVLAFIPIRKCQIEYLFIS